LFYFIPILGTLSDVVADCAFPAAAATVEDIADPPIEGILGRLGESDAILDTDGTVGNFGNAGTDGSGGNFGKDGNPLLNDFTIPPILPTVFSENAGFLIPPMMPPNPDGIFTSTFGISTFGTDSFGISTFGASGTASFGASIFGISNFGADGIFGTDGRLGIDAADGSAGALGKLIVGIDGAAIVGIDRLGMLFCF
jgi:hypothetical protein